MDPMKKKYWQIKIYHILLILVLVGGFNWGTTVLGFNFVEIIKNLLNNAIGIETYIDKLIYLVIAFAAIKLTLKRDLWLPFIVDTIKKTGGLYSYFMIGYNQIFTVVIIDKNIKRFFIYLINCVI